MGNNFKVDLGGVVDLLGRHLYSSPRVYLGELVQNAVDAITAREAAAPGADREVRVVPADVAGDGRLHVHDTGIGLTAAEVEDLMATIGRSSKRESADRGDLLGRFGIGLLSAFLVADEIEVVTRSVATGETSRWLGRADGTWSFAEPEAPRGAPGTTVSLAPREAGDDLATELTVRELLRTFAAYLPYRIVLETAEGPEQVTGAPFPWEDPMLAPTDRLAAARALCQDLLGFEPMEVLELADPETGTRGMAFVLPQAGGESVHRVYAKRMLLGETVGDVLPKWATFVRAVLNTDGLTPTAAREALYVDEALERARDRLGAQVSAWLLRLARTSPERLDRFLSVHSLGVRAMVARDPILLRAAMQWLPFATTVGPMPLADLVEDGRLRYCGTESEMAQIAPVAGALGLPVMNASYAYDRQILDAVEREGIATLERVEPTSLLSSLAEPAPDAAARLARVVTVAETALARVKVRPVLREFEPRTVPALLLTDRASRQERDRQETARSAPGPWGAALTAPEPVDDRPWLVLNAASPTVTALAAASLELAADVVEALYAHALVTGRHPVGPRDGELLRRALPQLIDRVINHHEGEK